jgi:uroporphyrinogen III methyltransferase/synthase
MKRRLVGTVSLVGAGPGNAKLLTLRGKELLESCDVVVHDKLVRDTLLGFAPRAKKVCVTSLTHGRRAEKVSAILRCLVRLARQGKHVVRLKGGDPFIFARGGEEALGLVRAGVPIEIVPGVTAAIGSAAYAGIPLTHRHVSSEVVFVTAHEDPAKAFTSVDWDRLAETSGTLVIYMGVNQLAGALSRLVAAGKPSSTPAAVIEWGTTGRQRTVVGTLRTVAGRAKKLGLKSPAVVVIGRVVHFRQELAWFEKKALFGKRVLMTRAASQAGALLERLESLGASVVRFPTIEIGLPKSFAELDRALEILRRYEWLVFTSENGVRFFMERLSAKGFDARTLAHAKIAAVGSGTAARLLSYGIRADLVPKEFSTRALFLALRRGHDLRGKRMLLLRTNIAPPWLAKGLRAQGALVHEVSVYQTLAPKLTAARVKQSLRQGVDYVTFTSAETVKNFFAFLTPSERRKLDCKLVSIGPVTSKAIRRYGARVYREANPSNLDGLVRALANGKGK